MSELWELCDQKSRAVLGYLYRMEYGCWPEWDERSGKKPRKPPVTMSPECEEDHLKEVQRFMSQAPSRSRGDADEI